MTIIAVDWGVKNQTNHLKCCYILKKLKACNLAVLLRLCIIPSDKNVQMNIYFVISQPKCMLWVHKRTKYCQEPLSIQNT